MRKYIYTILITTAFWGLNAQTCDILIKALKPISNTLEIGESTDLVFGILNNGHGSACAYAENSVHVYLFLPSTGLSFDKVLYPIEGNGEYFTWTYDAMSRTVIGVNHTPINNAKGEENITVRVKATNINATSSERTVGLSILQNPEGQVFPSNNASNDNATVTLRLNTPQFFKDLLYVVENTDCNLMKLSFESSTIINENIELQRSLDGISFLTLTKLKSDNPSDVFTYIDTNELKSGESYHYRLRQIDSNNKEQLFNLGAFDNICKDVVPTMVVFPNPALDRVYVSLKNIANSGDMDLIISNSIGERVMLIPSVNLQNMVEVKIQGLAAGIYNIKTSNAKIQGSRFIKIN